MSSNHLIRIAPVLIACVTTSAYADLVQFAPDLSSDPGWEGVRNRPADGPHDYGWSDTNQTGTGPGEIGGVMWRTENEQLSFYGMSLGGEVTMNDAWSFSGVAVFANRGSSSNMQLGFFSGMDSVNVSNDFSGNVPLNWAGILWNNGQAPIIRAVRPDGTRALNGSLPSGANIGDGVPSAFSMSYDPDTTKITLTVRGVTQTADLGGHAPLFDSFTHFGLLSGGSPNGWAEMYFGDMAFTAIPEPTTATVLGGLLALGLLRRRRRLKV